MKRVILFSTLLCAAGCLRPFTDRLDVTNRQLADTNAKLLEMSAKLDETNRRLATVERATKMIIPGLDKKE